RHRWRSDFAPARALLWRAFMRAIVVAVLVLGSGAPAIAARTDPPDVRRGEPYDGRMRREPAGKQLVVLPRMLLAPPRLLMRGVGAIAKPLIEWVEHNHVPETLYAAFTSEDGLVGVRPVVDYQLAFKPSGGVLYFNNRLGSGAGLVVSTAF